MEVKMNKEIRSYKERSFMNLTIRQLIFGGIGVAFGCLVAFSLRHTLSSSMMACVGTIAAIPFALAGDFGPEIQGLPFRKFLWILVRYTYLEPKQLKFVGNNYQRKEIETYGDSVEGKQEEGCESIESQASKGRTKRTLRHSKKRTGCNTGTNDMERRHFSKRKNLQ